MVRREIATNLGNSKGYNVETDDKTYMNYLALYSVIKSKVIDENRITFDVENIKKLFGVYETKTKPKKTNNKTEVNRQYTFKVIVENIKTGEIVEYENRKQAAEKIGISAEAVGVYIRKEYICKDTYKITDGERIERSRRGGQNKRKVKVTNIETGEVKELSSITEAAEYTKISTCQICYLAKNKKTTRGWSVEYL